MNGNTEKNEGCRLFIQKYGGERKPKDAVVSGLQLEDGHTRKEKVYG